jgi:CDP-glucose 4,6-dehydratase
VKSVVLTGHTGFKGSWFTRVLARRGYSVHGYSDRALPTSLYAKGWPLPYLASEVRGDIRDTERLSAFMRSTRSDTVVHLAAQSLVSTAYASPLDTFSVNALGTASVLDAAGSAPDIEVCLIVTTDKVYGGPEGAEFRREGDPLWGSDPYGSSKCAADLWAASLARLAHFRILIARAGNVIGAGDHNGRLLPDLSSSWRMGRSAPIRNPEHVRPWQHVLDCLNGYVALLESPADVAESGSAWNFGPTPEGHLRVLEVVELASRIWGEGATWHLAGSADGREQAFLALDTSKAIRQLGWRPDVPIEDAIQDALRDVPSEDFFD